MLAVSASQAGNVSVALVPVSIHATGGETEYLVSGLGDMLASRLEQYGGISVIRIESNARTSQESVAIEAARAAGADVALFGSFTRFGDGASIDLRAARVEDAESRRVFIQAGTLAEIIPQLDTLAQKVARFALGQAGPVVPADDAAAAAAASADRETQEELQRRVEALERVVYGSVAQGEAAAKPESPAAEGSGAPVR